MPESGTLSKELPEQMLSTRPSGKLVTLAVWGEFDKATIKLQAGFVAPDSMIKWMDMGETFNEAGLTNVLVKGNYFRLALGEPTDKTKINWWFG
jgi:hypothetical protein